MPSKYTPCKYDPKEWSDEETLKLLDMRDCEGLFFSTIADRLGRTKSAVIARYSRVIHDLELSERP